MWQKRLRYEKDLSVSVLVLSRVLRHMERSEHYWIFWFAGSLQENWRLEHVVVRTSLLYRAEVLLHWGCRAHHDYLYTPVYVLLRTEGRKGKSCRIATPSAGKRSDQDLRSKLAGDSIRPWVERSDRVLYLPRDFRNRSKCGLFPMLVKSCVP